MKKKPNYRFYRAKCDSPRNCDFPCVCLNDKEVSFPPVTEDNSSLNILSNCNKGLGRCIKPLPRFYKDDHKSPSKQS